MRLKNNYWVAVFFIGIILTGCLEVEDSSRDTGSVTIFGIIEDYETGETVENATIYLSIGASERNPVTTADGSFEFTNIPPNTDFELYVEAGDEYLSRAFYFSSAYTEDSETYQDTGALGLSKQETIEFSVIDTSNDQAVSGLQFWHESHVGNSSKSSSRRHISTYSSETGLYSIVLPTDFVVSVTAYLDTNGDDVRDFNKTDIGYFSGNKLIVQSDDLAETLQVNLSSPSSAESSTREFRVTVLDDTFESVSGLDLEIDSDVDGIETLSYDASTDQYVVIAEMEYSVDILVPAFELDDIQYLSSSITISIQTSSEGGNKLYVYFKGDRSHQTAYYLPADQSVIDLVIYPYQNNESTELEVALTSSNLDENPNRYKVFYSNSVAIEEGNIFIVRASALEVVRGDDSGSDFVLPGTTLITIADKELDTVDYELSLNDTLLSLQPTEAFTPGYFYYYKIDDVIDQSSETPVNIDDNSDWFEIKSNDEFELSDLILDNDNYFNEGAFIRASNTAGTPASSSSSSASVSLFLPLSIRSLEKFTLSKVLVVDDGTSESTSTYYDIIDDGEVRDPRLVNTVSTASNENIEGSYYSGVYRGTSLPDGKYYRLAISEHMNDHTNTDTNTVTFEYAYSVDGGEIQTGNITLEVQ
jgi:hypothetical protein